MRDVKNPPTPPSRERYHHGDLRRALLDASLALVTDHGVERFSLREAAREVGVSPAAAYRHFRDKDALLAALAAEAFGHLAEWMERAISKAPGEPGTPARQTAAFVAVGHAYVEFSVQHPAHFRVMFGPWCQREQVVALEGRTPYEILVETLDSLVTCGALAPAKRAGAEVAAWSAVHGLAALVVDGVLPLSKTERAEAMRHLGATLLLGLGCAPALLPWAGQGPQAPELCLRPPAERPSKGRRPPA
jgi:AcrR family transcriptional regulator